MERQKSKCRFIPNRGPWNNFSETSSQVERNLTQDVLDFRRKSYEKVLRQVLKIPGPERSLLFPASLPIKDNWDRKWPARPRKKPYIREPLISFKLPITKEDLTLQVLDWGPHGLACAVNAKLLVLPKSGDILSFDCIEEGYDSITCIKWHPTDAIIAVGMSNSEIQVWSIMPIKKQFHAFCCSGCMILALEWHPTKICLISGCCNGHIVNYCMDIPYRHFNGPIDSIKFSQSGDFMATVGGSENHLVLWDWKTKESIADISSLCTSNAFAWHPWNSILAIGTSDDEGTIYIVFPKTFRKMIYKSVTSMQVLHMTWSKLTGELVANVRMKNERGELKNIILIFGCLGVIVDMIDIWSTDCECGYLVWSPNGHIIGTATTSKRLFLWKFCEKRQRNSKAGRPSLTSMEKSLSSVIKPFGGLSSTIR